MAAQPPSAEHIRRRDNLVAEFRHILDESLILAICSDYNLRKPDQRRDARRNLEEIAQTARAEEGTGFNADGFGATEVACVPEQTQSNSGSPGRTESSVFNETCVTSPTSTAFSSEEEFLLGQFFPDVEPKVFNYLLKKHNGAIDTVSNVLFAAADSKTPFVIPNAVDSFFRPEDDCAASKKRKGKKKKSGQAELVAENDVIFLADRITEPIEAINNAYAEHGTLAKTVLSIAGANHKLGIVPTDPETLALADILKDKYKKIEAELLPVIVYMCIPELLPKNAHEVCAGVEKSLASKPKTQKLSIAYNVAPTEDDSLIDTNVPKGQPRREPVSRPTWRTISSDMVAVNTSSSLSDVVKQRQELEARRASAFAEATRQVRRSKSNGLHSAAISVYIERVQSLNASVRAHGSRIADLKVAGSSTSGQIDLHGVTVADAPRLAVEYVRDWWESGRRGEFKIITGRGAHSQGGVARIRKPVMTALKEDGWEFVEEVGMVIVTGARKNRGW